MQSWDERARSGMNKTTTIEITPEMEKWKNKFPSWKDGGPKWGHIVCAGIFREEDELFENIKVHLSVT